MTQAPKPRPHLVERAVEAFGAAGALGPAADRAAPAAAPAAPFPPPPGPVPTPAAPATPPPAPIGADALRRAGLRAAPGGGASRSLISEEMGVVQQQLLRAFKAAEPAEGRCARAILVTSARPGEGKTFVSLNLAAGIAAGGAAPVLLVDMDGKRGSVSDLLGVAEAPGLRLLAAGQAPQPAAALAIPTAQPRLRVLPYGAPAEGGPAAPPGPMLTAAVLRVAAALPDHILILDSPPCLSTSDPGSLAAVAGQVLMVVEAERTQREEVEAALDMVDACPVLQLVLNRTRLMASHSFGAYGSYDVQGGHGQRPGA